jgi:hypothetical protein
MTEVTQVAPEELSSAERLSIINDYRSRVRQGEDVPDEELKYAVQLVQTERSAAAGRSAEKKSTAKPAATPLSLDEL